MSAHEVAFSWWVGQVKGITVFVSVCGESIFKACAKYDFAHSLRERTKSYSFFRGRSGSCCIPDQRPSQGPPPPPVTGLTPAPGPLREVLTPGGKLLRVQGGPVSWTGGLGLYSSRSEVGLEVRQGEGPA